MCLTAWKLPIGRPNCSRTFALSHRLIEHLSCGAHEVGGQHQMARIGQTLRSVAARPGKRLCYGPIEDQHRGRPGSIDGVERDNFQGRRIPIQQIKIAALIGD